jgi:hypothetical protein
MAKKLVAAFSTLGPFVVVLASCSSSTTTASKAQADAGNGASGNLTQDWFTGPSNCWIAALDEVKACVPATDYCEFNGMKPMTSCTYMNGMIGTWSPALPAQPIPAGTDIHYVLKDKKGVLCNEFESTYPDPMMRSTKATITLATASGTVTVVFDGDAYSVSCPDGTTVSTDHLSLVLGLGARPAGGTAYSGDITVELTYGLGASNPNETISGISTF